VARLHAASFAARRGKMRTFCGEPCAVRTFVCCSCLLCVAPFTCVVLAAVVLTVNRKHRVHVPLHAIAVCAVFVMGGL
jgi:hypothetical protein